MNTLLVAFFAVLSGVGDDLVQTSTGTSAPSSIEVIEVAGERVTQRALETRRAAALDIIELDLEAAQAVDMATLLRGARGVIVRQNGGLGSDTTLSLNGLTGRQVPVFIDGLPIALSGFSNNIGTIPVGFMEKINIHKGVVPIEIGSDALGGAIDLRTRSSGTAMGLASYEISSFETHRLLAEVQSPLGEFAYIQVSSFYDETQNNFDITTDDELPNGQVVRDALRVPKNNAQYQSFGVIAETGLRHVDWADRVSVAAFYNDSRRGLPHDARQLEAYGELEVGRATYGGRAQFEREGIGELFDISLGLGVVRTHFRATDLANTSYNFQGEPEAVLEPPGELIRGGIERDLETTLSLVRARLAWNFLPSQSLVLSLAPTYEVRSGDDQVPSEPPVVREFPEVSRLAFVSGLSYRWEDSYLPFDNDAFVKLYILDGQGENVQLGFGTGAFSIQTTEVGFGDSLLIELNDVLSFRASGEWTTRLPDFVELFGNGLLVVGNRDLVPERSLNFNLSGSITDWKTEFGIFNMTFWGFSRFAENMIILQEAIRFENVGSATIYGFETEVSWDSPRDIVSISGSLTYEETENTSAEGGFARFRGERLPNRPFLYGSARVDVGKSDLFTKVDRAGIITTLRWVEAFFLTSESAGARETKAEVESQLTLDMSIFYRFPVPFSDKAVYTNLSLESHNILDAELFDRFGVQRPGRSYHAKLSVDISP